MAADPPPTAPPARALPGPGAAAPADETDEQTVFRTLFAAYPDSLLLVDASGAIVLANPSAGALLGYAPEELVGKSVDTLVPDSIRPRHAEFRKAYGRHPRPRPMGTQMDLVAKRRDGSQVMVEIALSPLQDHGLPYVVAAIRDIGAYPRVKQALQRARYSDRVAQLGSLAVDARDPQALIQRVPAIAAEALEIEEALVYLLEPSRLEFRVAGRAGPVATEPIGAASPNRPDSQAGHVLARGTATLCGDFAAERRFAIPPACLAAGLRSSLAVPLSDRGRSVGALLVRSTQAQRFGEDELNFLQSLANLLATSLQRAQTEEALNHAQRLESVGQLTGGIAHDFNNLLTVIQGNLQVLEELPSIAGEPQAQRLVAAATRASKRGAELTRKLLAFSRRQVLQPAAVDLQAMLQSLADLLRRTLDQRIRIEVRVDPGCPCCMADPGQLESALLNIAINARDAMPDGGLLRFSAAACTLLPLEVRSELDEPLARDDQHVAIAVEDTGCGMPEAVKERAFEPFFTTKEAGRGTGLGLSTVYGFAKQSHGAVAIDSVPGQGTTVTLYIPRVPADSPGDSVEDGPEAPGLPAGLPVLLVEDDVEVRSTVLAFLEHLQCEVTACATAEQALPLLGPSAGFAVLLTDIALGAGMRGTQLAALARARNPRLAIVLMSGYSSELLDAAREGQADWELLRKPYRREDLAEAVWRALRERDAA